MPKQQKEHQNQEVIVTVVYREEEKNRSKGVGKSSASKSVRLQSSGWLSVGKLVSRGFE
jgi:hypothetical protein